MRSHVGIIANPASGKDIRRLVSHATVVNNHEKASIVRRVLVALHASGVEQVDIMPDPFGIGARALVPCTPTGSLILAKTVQENLSGLDAVVIGRSNIVGKPMASLLLSQSCTVTVAHSRTKDLPGVVKRADLVVAAVGIPEFVKGDWIKPGAIVIDVGINRVPKGDGKTKLVGDCDYEGCARVAGAITPVPGGVGPMTIACLLKNTVEAALIQKGLPALS